MADLFKMVCGICDREIDGRVVKLGSISSRPDVPTRCYECDVSGRDQTLAALRDLKAERARD
jgi:ribosome-binding protein aMBF1 (putative translation factor)